MKALMMALMLVVATTGLASPVAVEDSTNLSGAWVFTIDTGNGVLTGDAFLTTEDQLVSGTLSSPSGDLRVFGSHSSEVVSIYAASGDSVVLAFSGDRTPGNMSGTVQFEGVGAVTWSAKRK